MYYRGWVCQWFVHQTSAYNKAIFYVYGAFHYCYKWQRKNLGYYKYFVPLLQFNNCPIIAPWSTVVAALDADYILDFFCVSFFGKEYIISRHIKMFLWQPQAIYSKSTTPSFGCSSFICLQLEIAIFYK